MRGYKEVFFPYRVDFLYSQKAERFIEEIKTKHFPICACNRFILSAIPIFLSSLPNGAVIKQDSQTEIFFSCIILFI